MEEGKYGVVSNPHLGITQPLPSLSRTEKGVGGRQRALNKDGEVSNL